MQVKVREVVFTGGVSLKKKTKKCDYFDVTPSIRGWFTYKLYTVF